MSIYNDITNTYAAYRLESEAQRSGNLQVDTLIQNIATVPSDTLFEVADIQQMIRTKELRQNILGAPGLSPTSLTQLVQVGRDRFRDSQAESLRAQELLGDIQMLKQRLRESRRISATSEGHIETLEAELQKQGEFIGKLDQRILDVQDDAQSEIERLTLQARAIDARAKDRIAQLEEQLESEKKVALFKTGEADSARMQLEELRKEHEQQERQYVWGHRMNSKKNTKLKLHNSRRN